MKMKLRVQILSLVLIPAFIIGFVSIWVSSSNISALMDQEMQSQLKVSAYAGREFYETMNDGMFSRDEDGIVCKGDFIITDNYDMVDTIRQSGDIYATFFYQDERIVTNVLDDKGARMVGTKAGEAVIQAVLNGGEDYFSKSVVIDGEEYYGYYTPVRQPGSDEVIGMFFTGDRKGQITESVTGVSITIAVVILAIIVISGLVAVIIIMKMTNALKRTVASLDRLSEGELKGETVHKDNKRKDEIGEIVRATYKLRDTLTQLIGNINNTVDTLYQASKDIEGVVGNTLHNTDDISKAIEELSKASLQQAISVEGVSHHVSHMGDSVQGTITSVDELNENAAAINDSSQSTISVLNHLDGENRKVIEAMERVYEQTNATHEYVEKIEAVMEMIREIAEETNMLSLNATIEAARAGEAGRGFAVVAEQVKKLAEQSGDSTVQIGEVIKNLNENSTKAVNTMEQVKETVRMQNKQILDVLASYDAVNASIKKTSDVVNQVSDQSREINHAREEVVSLVSELCALSEENAQSTKVTSMAAEDLAAAMQEMEGEVISLRDMAERLTSDVKIFKL